MRRYDVVNRMTEALSSWLVIGAGRGSNFDNSANSAFSFSRRFLAALLDFSFMVDDLVVLISGRKSFPDDDQSQIEDKSWERQLKNWRHRQGCLWFESKATFIDHGTRVVVFFARRRSSWSKDSWSRETYCIRDDDDDLKEERKIERNERVSPSFWEQVDHEKFASQFVLLRV